MAGQDYEYRRAQTVRLLAVGECGQLCRISGGADIGSGGAADDIWTVGVVHRQVSSTFLAFSESEPAFHEKTC